MDQGIGGRVLIKKTRGKISRVSVPLRPLFLQSRFNAWLCNNIPNPFLSVEGGEREVGKKEIDR
jgi:hypothetical protein